MFIVTDGAGRSLIRTTNFNLAISILRAFSSHGIATVLNVA